jgi:hypothetical protein
MPSKRKLDDAAKLTSPIRLTLPISVAYDLDKFQTALANVAQMVGYTGGTHKAEVNFLHVREFIVDPASLQVREAAGER